MNPFKAAHTLYSEVRVSWGYVNPPGPAMHSEWVMQTLVHRRSAPAILSRCGRCASASDKARNQTLNSMAAVRKYT